MKISRHGVILVLVLAVVLCLCVACNREEKSDSVSDSVSAQPVETIKTPEITRYDYNHLTGTEAIKGFTAGTRPVAVMIDNVGAALPQTGVSAADVVYETETEGGLTRLMAVFADYKSITAIGPVRSVRDQFCELAMAQNAILVNIGSSIYADDMLNYFGYQNVDGIYLGTNAFSYDIQRAKDKGSEHAWYTNNELISKGIEINEVDTVGGYYPLFNFTKSGENIAEDYDGTAADSVSFNFSKITAAKLKYNSKNSQYEKYFNGNPQDDILNNSPLAFDNLLILFCDVVLRPDGLCTEFSLTKGEGVYVIAGQYLNIAWAKGNPAQQLKIYSKTGGEQKIKPGKSYIAFVANSQKDSLIFS